MRACRKVTSKLLPLPFATAIRTEANIPSTSVGFTTEAGYIIATSEADAVFFTRAMPRNLRQTVMASEGLDHRSKWAFS
jgi:hypothetical protein